MEEDKPADQRGTYMAPELFNNSAQTSEGGHQQGMMTITQAPTGPNTGMFSGNTGFWNTGTNQNSSVLSGSYTPETLTTRVTGTTNTLGATSFDAYELSTNQFVRVGSTSSGTGTVLVIF